MHLELKKEAFFNMFRGSFNPPPKSNGPALRLYMPQAYLCIYDLYYSVTWGRWSARL